MEFEQLSFLNPIDEDHFDSPVLPLFNYQDCDGKIFSKIDWISAVFTDCSMSDVLQWVGLDDCQSDFLVGFYQRCRGFDNRFNFTFNGVTLDSSEFSFYGHNVDVLLFDVVLPRINLQISGSGLDFLRSVSIDPDVLVKKPFANNGGNFHFTRIDYAFDFINCFPGFVDSLIDHINTHKLPSERVPVLGLNGGIKAQIQLGGKKVVYLGSPQSDRMLRVYDKRMQFIDLGTGVYKKSNPYNDPDSWFRIEWQIRNAFANEMIYSDLDHLHILKKIFERYAFTSGSNSHNRVIVDFWNYLLPWSEIESRYIQNLHFV